MALVPALPKVLNKKINEYAGIEELFISAVQAGNFSDVQH